MSEKLILHHYGISPFSEKIRLIFGLKNLEWNSVIIPEVMPKPSFTPLTGGNRRTPALQIGADIYCDTRLIVQILEERYPHPSVYGKYSPGMSNAIMTWAEDQFFWPGARYITGINADHVDKSLHSDRAAMRGNKPPDLERVKKAAHRNLPEMLIQFEWVQDVLSRTQAYMLGDEVSLADLAVYHGIWFLGVMKINALSLIEPYPAILPWMKRVEQLGHGIVNEFSAEEAIKIAKSAEPAPLRESIIDSVAPPLGSQVTVQPLDYGSDPVQGELVYLGRNHVTLRRETGSELGSMAVHFPRMQYMLKAVRLGHQTPG
tara:strand:- start:10105 stop:11055 length:951 start_codon:yes stop_codon:yes gene_type:complete